MFVRLSWLYSVNVFLDVQADPFLIAMHEPQHLIQVLELSSLLGLLSVRCHGCPAITAEPVTLRTGLVALRVSVGLRRRLCLRWLCKLATEAPGLLGSAEALATDAPVFSSSQDPVLCAATVAKL